MTTLPAPTVASLSDADLVKSINDKVRSMLASYRSSVGHAVEVGELLKEAKARVGHGNFEPWLKEHCNLSFRTARRYMKLAENRAQIEAQFKSANVADLTVSGAQRLLTDNSGGSGGSKSGQRTPAGDYDKLEEQLIKKLKELDASEAKDHADKTIAALNDTVEDIVSIAKRATKAAKLGADSSIYTTLSCTHDVGSREKCKCERVRIGSVSNVWRPTGAPTRPSVGAHRSVVRNFGTNKPRLLVVSGGEQGGRG